MIDSNSTLLVIRFINGYLKSEFVTIGICGDESTVTKSYLILTDIDIPVSASINIIFTIIIFYKI